MPDLCRDSDDDEDDILNYYVHGAEKSLEEMVPRRFRRWMKVFEKKASEQMLRRKPCDHAIKMKPGYEPKKAKNIQLSPQEQKEVEGS